MLSNQHFLLNRKCAIIAAHNRQLQKRILFVRRRWFWRGCCCWFSQLVFLCLSYILTLFSQFRCLLLAATQECVSNNGKVTTHRLPTAKIESYQKRIWTFIFKQDLLRPNILGPIHLPLMNGLSVRCVLINSKEKKVLYITHLTDGAGEFSSLTLSPYLQVFWRLWKPHFDSFPRSWILGPELFSFQTLVLWLYSDHHYDG